MHTRKIRRYFTVPLIYVAVIFGLLYLQFSGSLTVKRSMGDLNLTASILPGGDETSKGISSTTIRYQGLVIEFSEDSPIQLLSEDDDDLILLPVEYEEEPNAFIVQLSDGSRIRFTVTSNAPAELHISPEPGPVWAPDMVLALPFALDGTAELIPAEVGAPESLQIRYDDITYYLSAPPRTQTDTEQFQLLIPLAGTSRLVRYAEMGEQRLRVVDVAFADEQRRISDLFYTETIDDYLELAYQGWGSVRFNGGSGTWNFRDGSPRFSEEILTAYLAEAWYRNDYTQAFNQMRRAADLHEDSVGLLSSVFLGNLRDVTPRFLSADTDRTERLLSRIRSNDSTVFQERDLLTFAAYRGGSDLYRELVEFMQYVDFRNVSIPTAIGMLLNSFDSDFPTPDIAETVTRFRTIVEERIFPSIVQFDDYFFVETSLGEIDVINSIQAGRILQTIGEEEGEQLLITVGRNLVLSALSLADGTGYLPRILYFNEGGMQGQEGSFGPEEIYPDFTDNPNYPRFISLYDVYGNGSFIWTIVEFSNVSAKEEQFRATLRYPRNRTHYIIMQGIPEFTNMQLFGRDWRDDPTFEAYIKGRHYDEETQTLMIKYTDNSVQEDIVLDF